MLSMHFEKPMLHPISQKFSQCCLWNGSSGHWLTMALSRPFKEDCLTLPLSLPLSSRWSVVWCPWLCALSTLELPRSKPLVRVALATSLSAGSFPFTLACPGLYTHRSFQRWMSTINTFQSGLPIPLFTFCSKLIQSVRLMACVVCHLLRQSSRGHGWLLQSPLSSWRLRPYIGCTVFMDGSHTLLDNEASPWLVFGDWAICVHYEVLQFVFFLNEKLNLWFCFACGPFSAMLSQVFWQECLIEMPELVWVPFPLLGLLELCQLAYLQYWVLCLTHPRLAPSQSASLCVFHGFVEWVVGSFDGTEVCFDLLRFLSGLHWLEI